MEKFLRTLFLLSIIGCQQVDQGEQGNIEFTSGGSEFSSSYKDEIVVLNIWADWCPPCIKEFPYFNQVNKIEGVTVLGFHFDQFDVIADEEILKNLEKYNVEFRNIKTDPREIWGMDIPSHVPTTYIIKNGVIVKTLIKPQTYESLVFEIGLNQ